MPLRSDDMAKYTGIADAHGLESFFPVEGNERHQMMIQMRAGLNRQRHALVFEVELDDAQAQTIKAILQEGDFIGACQVLHDPNFVEFVGVEKDMIDSWEMLPNPRLDPYGGHFTDEEE